MAPRANAATFQAGLAHAYPQPTPTEAWQSKFRAPLPTRLLGVQPGIGSVQSGVWLPHTQVNNHVRVSVVNNGANAVTIAGFHQVKRTSLQTPARWVGINTNYFANGRIFFKQRANKRAKFSTQASDNNSASAHGLYLTPTA
jgi:hypothetical protein